MAKKESSLINMISTLVLITLVAGVALAGVYDLTKEPIARSQKAKLEKAIKAVIPDFEEIREYKVKPDDSDEELVFYEGLKGDSIVGVAIQTYTDKGFSGRISVMVGFLPDGSILNTEVIKHQETPGLGTKLMDEAWKIKFRGMNIAELAGEAVKVTKDQGTVDAITAATISSRAFCDAVQRAYNTKKKGGKNE
ncbi:MAG: RnfABCDGE type electron transport complex subunit G [Bacteroidales bacterium]|jgi:electron transport complex protein RnfG|nr:RnfABCDGE type electron transport complex subunit G [Bacteroidales bacterium]